MNVWLQLTNNLLATWLSGLLSSSDTVNEPRDILHGEVRLQVNVWKLVTIDILV